MFFVLNPIKIESIEELSKIGKDISQNNLIYRIHLNDNEYQIVVYEGTDKVYEFICDKVGSQAFFNEAVNF